MTDEVEAVARIAAGDEEAFASLYQSYQQRVFGYLFRLIRDAAAAEEIVDDVMMQVWRGAARFRGESRVSTWIFGIAHHKALDALRARRVRVSEEPSEELADPAPGADEVLAREDLRGRLALAVDALSPQHREVVELTLTEGFTVEEISRIVGIPPGTVKTRMFHARRSLRRLLSDRGLTAESI